MACAARRSFGPQRSTACSATNWKLLHRWPTTRQGLPLACGALCDIYEGRTSYILAATMQTQPQDAARAMCCVRGS